MRKRWTWIVGSLVLVSLVAPAVARAQRGGDTGPTPIGRRGYEWETAQDAAKEDQKRMAVELAALSEEAWKSRALAWIELAPGGAEGQVAVPGSDRVAGIEAKKAEVEAAPDAEGSWTIAWTKRHPPAAVTLVLTDVAGTKVQCPFRSAVEDGDVALGVFQNKTGSLLCMPRKKGT